MLPRVIAIVETIIVNDLLLVSQTPILTKTRIRVAHSVKLHQNCPVIKRTIILPSFPRLKLEEK